MTENNSNIRNYQDLYNAVGEIHEQKRNNLQNVFDEIREKFDYLLKDENLDTSELDMLLNIDEGEVPSQTVYYDCVSTMGNAENSMKKTTSSQMNFKVESSNATYYLEEIKNQDKSTQSKDKLLRCIKDEPPADSLMMASEQSFLKNSICTDEMNCPLGTSTPTSDDDFNTPLVPNNTQEFSRNVPYNRSLRLKTQVLKSNNTALRDKNVNTHLSKTKLGAAHKKKTVVLNVPLAANKRKRGDDGTQEVTTQREAIQKVKRQAAVKVEKRIAEKNKIAQKKKDDALLLKSTPKTQIQTIKKNPNSVKIKKNQINAPSISKSEIVEYNIDHIIEECSSDEENSPKNKIPNWATEEMRQHPVMVQSWLDKSEIITPWFFSERLKNPSLEDLFSTKMRLRARTSSAIWH